MTKTKNLDEIKKTKEQEKLDAETKEVAAKVDTLLKEHSYSLQTYLQPVMELGVLRSFEGRVRLIKVKSEDKKELNEETSK